MKFQPHQIVVIKRDGFRHYGEVMSFKTPEQTVMVRRVPGHPGTLEEVQVELLSQAESNVKWVHYATVTGVGQFPVDMLRYDMATPLNFKIVESFTGPKAGPIDPMFGFNELVVAQASQYRESRWTHARWGSFLWGVKELKSLPIAE